MKNLQHRVPADASLSFSLSRLSVTNKTQLIVASGLGGQNQPRTKAGLRGSIIQAFPKPGNPFKFMKVKGKLEASLVPWVIAEPKAFPELKAMPFIFAHIAPV
jgi:hypothetical protein